MGAIFGIDDAAAMTAQLMQTRVWHESDGGIVHRYTLEPSGRLTRERLTPGRSAHLEHNKRRQLEPESVRKLDWGKLGLSIPPNDYQRLLHQKPELKCWDKDIRTKAWKKFMASSESKPYRVQERV